MDAERWNRVKALLGEVLELPRSEANPWLRAECGVDDSLFQEVWSLLEADDEQVNFLDHPVKMPAEPDRQGERIGAYQVGRLLGKGGMGEVYEAFRADDEYHRRVALKLIKRGMDTDEIISRFRRERQILAHLEHPNIAKLYDGGTAPDGRPYLVLEYVEGSNILEYCDRHDLNLQQRLALFLKVCSAIQFAHNNLVVHRDLKPGNILVSEKGEPKLLDFGIAKLLDNGADANAAHTKTAEGLYLMTPDYASPEQINGETITTATDTYSLGILLYELLTGMHPFRLNGNSRLEVLRLAVAEIKTRPGEAVKRAMARPESRQKFGSNHLKMHRQLKGDLDNIIMMALRRDPARRYASVWEFSEDIQLYLRGFPIHARPETLCYSLQKFISRHRLAVALAIAGSLLTLTVLSIALIQQRELKRERAEMKVVEKFLVDTLMKTDPNAIQGTQQSLEAVLDDARLHIADFRDNPAVRIRLLSAWGRIYVNHGRFEPAREMFEETRQLLEESIGLEDTRATEPLYNLADVYQKLMQTQRAAETQSLALKLMLRNPEVPASRRARVSRELGIIYLDQQDFEKALPLLQQAQALVANDGQVDVLAENLIALARYHRETGAYELADQLLDQAFNLEIQAVVGAPPYLAELLTNRGLIYQGALCYDTALASFEESLKIMEVAMGPDHPSLAPTRAQLANCLLDLKQYARAQDLLEKTVTLLEANQNTDHRLSAPILRDLARCYREQNLLPRALEYSTRALQLFPPAAKSQNPQFLEAQREHILVLLASAQTQQARALIQEGCQILESASARNYRLTGVFHLLEGLANLCEEKPEKAQEQFNQGLAILKECYRDPHPQVVLAQIQIGKMYEASNPGIAINWYQQAWLNLENCKKHYKTMVPTADEELSQSINRLKVE